MTDLDRFFASMAVLNPAELLQHLVTHSPLNEVITDAEINLEINRQINNQLLLRHHEMERMKIINNPPLISTIPEKNNDS